MIQTKIFTCYDNKLQELQDAINNWLAEHPQTVVKDIKFNSSLTSNEFDYAGLYSAMVIYEHD